MILVGLVGPIGAGKTTLAQRLVDQWGFTRIGFADVLKAEVARTIPQTLRAYVRAIYPDIAEENVLGHIHRLLWVKRDDFSRSLLQEWGTELRRAEDPDYWVRQWANQARGLPRVVADDVRFPNEAQMIHTLGGSLVRVQRASSTVAALHASETALADWHAVDHHLVNDGTIEEWLVEADRLAKAIGAG